jgi:hypothetical protein
MNYKSLFIKRVACCLLVLSTSTSFAQTTSWLSCTGKIWYGLVFSDGTVNIMPDWRGDWVPICNVTSVRQGIDPSTCRSWYSGVLSAMAQKQTTVVTFNVPASVSSCSILPTGAATPTIGYFMTVGNP